jgi:hypothetical protein
MTTSHQRIDIKLSSIVMDELAALDALYTAVGRQAVHVAHRLDEDLPLDASSAPAAGHCLNELMLTAHHSAQISGLNPGMDPPSVDRRQELARLSVRRQRAVYQRTGSQLGGRGIQTFEIEDVDAQAAGA